MMGEFEIQERPVAASGPDATMVAAYGGLINVELEAVVLGTMMMDNGLIDMAADRLSSADFYEPVHSRIFDAIVGQHSLGRASTPVTIKGLFSSPDDPIVALGGPTYLMHLTTDSVGLLSPREHVRQLADIGARRRMYDGLHQAMQICADMERPETEVIDLADTALTPRSKSTIHQPTGGEAIDEMMESWSDGDIGVRCHCIPELDNLWGTLRPKELIIGAGRPGMGKTAMALSYALGAARNGHGVLFASLEMSARELAARAAADLCFQGQEGVPYPGIRDGKLNDWQMKRVREASQALHRMPFQIVDAGSLTTGRLNLLVRRHARRMKARGQRLELVIVDYLQLLHPDTKMRSNYEAVSEVSRALKAIAKDHGVAVLALAQLSREVEKRPDKRPQLSDLRDSGQIEQDADGVMFLLREEYYLRQSQPDPLSPKFAEWEESVERVAGRIEFILAKRRNGTTGSARGSFYGLYQAVRG